MNIEIVINQLTVQPKPILVIGGSDNYVNAVFRFDSDWDGLSKAVTFYTSNAAYDVLLVSDTCEVPHELLVGGNEIFITVSGYGDKTIRTKAMLKGIKVYLEGTYQGTTPGAYSPELWEQVLSQINQKQDKISAVDINDKNHLIITLSNGGIMDAGLIDIDTAVDKKITEKLADKQDKKISDEGGYFTAKTVDGALQEIGAKKEEWDGKYSKPSSGIPKTDLASAVKTSLDKADTAYQKPTSGIPSSDLDYSTFPVVTLTATLEDGTTKTYSLFGSEVTE